MLCNLNEDKNSSSVYIRKENIALVKNNPNTNSKTIKRFLLAVEKVQKK